MIRNTGSTADDDRPELLPKTMPSNSLTPAGSERPSSGRSIAVSLSVLRGLVEAVERAGIPRTEFMRAAGFDNDHMGTPEGRMELSQLYGVCELALDLTGDPALGLHWAESASDRAFAPISPLIAHSSTLRQGLELLAQFFHVLCNETAYRVIERDDEVAVHFLHMGGDSSRVKRFTSEMEVLGFWRLVRSFNPNARHMRASFEYGAPAHRSEYRRLFEGAVSFDQPFTGVVFDRSLLNTPSPHEDEEVRDALKTLVEQRLLRIAHRTPYADRVREFLVHRGFPHQTDMKSVARGLEISVRSLHRRLASEGKSYNGLLSEALAIVAKNLLRDQSRTIQEVAYEMGFSGAATFHRAFKRWTKMTPKTYRQAQMGTGG